MSIKIAEYAVENPKKLLQIEKQLAIGLLMIDDINYKIRKYVIPNNRIQIGRYDNCDIILENRFISNEHCAISSKEKKVFLEDLISKNGTFLNGIRIQSKKELKDGDEIRIEDRIIIFKKLSH